MQDSAIPGLVEVADAHRWSGPALDPPTEPRLRTQARALTMAVWDYRIYLDLVMSPVEAPVGEPRLVHVCTGYHRRLPMMVANVYASWGPQVFPASLAMLTLPFMVPNLVVVPRPPTGLPVGGTTMTGDRAFDGGFQIRPGDGGPGVVDQGLVNVIFVPALRAAIGRRPDWAFAFVGDRVLGVCREPLRAGTDALAFLDALMSTAAQVPQDAAEQYGMQMPRLPDGTVFNPNDPRTAAALDRMTPEQHREYMREAQLRGNHALNRLFGRES
jgi:hypothetical protein